MATKSWDPLNHRWPAEQRLQDRRPQQGLRCPASTPVWTLCEFGAEGWAADSKRCPVRPPSRSPPSPSPLRTQKGAPLGCGDTISPPRGSHQRGKKTRRPLRASGKVRPRPHRHLFSLPGGSEFAQGPLRAQYSGSPCPQALTQNLRSFPRLRSPPCFSWAP